MAQVHADPEELRDLANVLLERVGELREVVQAMQNALVGAGNWQDSKREQCEEALGDLANHVNNYADFAEEDLIPWLRNRAESLECYNQ